MLAFSLLEASIADRINAKLMLATQWATMVSPSCCGADGAALDDPASAGVLSFATGIAMA